MISADAYLFDIDGTLMITKGGVHWGGMYQAMREVFGIDTTVDGIPYHGKTDVAILRAALNRAGVSDETFYQGLPRALAVVRGHVSANFERIVPHVCPGIPEVLAEIDEAGRLLGVASGNLEEVGWHKIRAAQLREFFQFGSFGDSYELRAQIFDEAASRAKAILGADAAICFVGDTPEDIAAAKQVNANIIAVGTGVFSREDLSAHRPDLCCESCAELLGRLNKQHTA
jgi:phosphoglycolate phosphatase